MIRGVFIKKIIWLMALMGGLLFPAHAQENSPAQLVNRLTVYTGGQVFYPMKAEQSITDFNRLAGLHSSLYVPFFQKGAFSLGLSGGIDAGWSDRNSFSFIAEPINIERAEASSIQYMSKGGSNSNQQFRSYGAGLQANFLIKNTVAISPIFQVGYQQYLINGYSLEQKTTTGREEFNGSIAVYQGADLSSINYVQKLRVNYFINKWLGVWADVGYSFGNRFEDEVNLFQPLGEPNEAGEYTLAQIIEGGFVPVPQIYRANPITLAAGLSFSIQTAAKGKLSTKVQKQKATKPEKAALATVKHQSTPPRAQATASTAKAPGTPAGSQSSQMGQDMLMGDEAEFTVETVRLNANSSSNEFQREMEKACIQLLSPNLHKNVEGEVVEFRFKNPMPAAIHHITIWKKEEIDESSYYYYVVHEARTSQLAYSWKRGKVEEDAEYKWSVRSDAGDQACGEAFFQTKSNNPKLEIDSIACNWTETDCQYTVTITYTNENTNATHKITAIQGPNQNFPGYTSAASLSNVNPPIPPFGLQVAPGNSVQFTISYTPANCGDTTLAISLNYLHGNSPILNTLGIDKALPQCQCTYCDQVSLTTCPTGTPIVLNPVSIIGNQMLISDRICPQLLGSSMPFVSVRAEIVGFAYAPVNKNNIGNLECFQCADNSDRYGNYSLSGISAAPLPSGFTPGNNPHLSPLPIFTGVGTLHGGRELIWQAENGVAGTANPQFKLSINLPTASTLSCCTMRYCVWIRYTVADKDCQSCSIVKRYCANPKSSVTLNPSTPLPAPTPMPNPGGTVLPGRN